MKTIAIDMDDVMADTSGTHLELFNKDYNDIVTLDDLDNVTLTQLRPHLKNEIIDYFNRHEFFRNIKVMDHSQEVIRSLSKKYKIFIATAAMEVPASFAGKYEWLKEHFDFLSEHNFVFCGDKSIIKTDYLIDDSIIQLDRFSGKGILFDSYRNKNNDKYYRVHNWLEVGEYFL